MRARHAAGIGGVEAAGLTRGALGGGLVLLVAAALSIFLLRRSTATPAAPVGAPIAQRYAGINLASASFGTRTLPGVYGRDYIYPSARDAAPFVDAGMTAVRLPFRWERIQPRPGAALDPAELKRLDAAVEAFGSFRMIILDVHNYAGHSRKKLGSAELPETALPELWTRLATRYGRNPRIAFGIMNEPIGIEAVAWRRIADATLRAIRATGARNLILVPGIRWTGAHSWIKGNPSNAEAMAGMRDPANNFAFEMHQYVDGNSSGLGKDCVSPERAAARLAAATGWLRTARARGFLAEFGAPATPECLAALDALMDALDDGSDVWLGWTYWAAGPRWNRYPMSVQPDASGEKPQMKILLKHLPK